MFSPPRALLVFLVPVMLALAAEASGNFEALQQRLIADGFDPEGIRQMYRHPGVTFETDTIALFFTYRESKLNYDQFLSDENLKKARRYQGEHEGWLKRAEDVYDVDRHVITAIILVETRLGTYLGNRAIFNTLSSMASLQDSGVRERFWNDIAPEKRIGRDRFEEKADAKSRWAYGELKAFLKLASNENMEPLAVVGSFAGAMGIAQFMPSNVLRLARDGNGDGRIDLFDHADAIASVANYLSHHGWRRDIDRQTAYNVLLRYNYSKYYVNTILKIADALRGSPWT